MGAEYVIQIANNAYVNTETFRIKYVNVTASADSCAITLRNSAGNPFFQAESSVSNKRFFFGNLGGQKVVGISVGTWEDIESVLVGVEKVDT